ncbi:13.88 kDa late protein [Salmonella phage CTH7]|uniref:13.88 kDa late protein n=1 Tax=Salmonella phage CTH7 TaxID=2950460 RepID=A0A9E7SIE4_9CAUD|nr:13.88 kDa late protein [Salmonella phage CTH7]URQ02908.1 13.88 kDa late protein [Salmonella phage PST-H1]USL89613.1 13.88 kDa late protein [Salmonella phage nctD30]USL89714.1 13.88 kDa late protein [Salmonella phage pse-D34]UTQ79645.1 13.88 kDa late protein [Salmonella phage NCTh5]USL89655.1 13.88 kDa late protein [Salmonella phage CTH7]
MLEQFIKLFERFVVAHELIAANSAKQTSNKSVSEMTVDVSVAGVETVKKELAKAPEEVEKAKEIPVEGEDIVDTKPAEEEKPKRKPRKAKVEEPVQEEKEEIDYQSLRDQIHAIDDAINEGPSDAACDDSDELLEEFTGKKMKIAAIKDEDLAEYLERLTAIKNKYFEEE